MRQAKYIRHFLHLGWVHADSIALFSIRHDVNKVHRCVRTYPSNTYVIDELMEL